MLLMVKVEVPVLVRVKLWGELEVSIPWLLKVRLEADKLASGAVPVPVRLTVCGLFVALSEKVNVAVRLPPVAGANVTLTVQLAFTPSELPHVVVSAKSPGLVPVI